MTKQKYDATLDDVINVTTSALLFQKFTTMFFSIPLLCLAIGHITATENWDVQSLDSDWYSLMQLVDIWSRLEESTVQKAKNIIHGLSVKTLEKRDK